MDALNELCENIDASVFCGDLVWQVNQRQLLKKYVGRWSRAIAEHEAYIEANPELANVEFVEIGSGE